MNKLKGEIKMEILQQSKNGVVTMAVKTVKEMDEQELQVAEKSLACNEELSTYETYIVRINKDNEIIGVQGNEYSETKSEQIKQDSETPDALDAMQVLAGHGVSKEVAKRKIEKVAKEAGVTSEQVINRLVKGGNN